MTRQIIILFILAFRISIQPVYSQHGTSLTEGLSSVQSNSTMPKPATFISVSGSISNNKAIIDWTVGENETADKFEVEKSTDGKNFSMAALVFGTDKPATDQYQFYEKAGKVKILYRIKLINKNKETVYSTIIEINPVL